MIITVLHDFHVELSGRRPDNPSHRFPVFVFTNVWLDETRLPAAFLAAADLNTRNIRLANY